MTSEPLHAAVKNTGEQPQGTDRPTFAWRAHPAHERPGMAALAVLAILVFSAAVAEAGQQLAWGLLASVILCLSLRRFFFPTRYELDADGITSSTAVSRRRLRWSQVRRVDVGRRAAWLSESPIRSWRERRGMHILFGNERDAVLGQLRAHRPALERQADAGPHRGQPAAGPKRDSRA